MMAALFEGDLCVGWLSIMSWALLIGSQLALILLHFDVSFYYSGLSYIGRDLLMDDYLDTEPDERSKPRILIGTMRLMKTGHNIQRNTNVVIFFDSPITESTKTQGVHWVQRLHSPFEHIDIREYTISNTFYDAIFLERLRKAMSGILLMVESDSIGMNTANGEVELDDEWVRSTENNMPIKKSDDAFLQLGEASNHLPTLNFETLIKKLLKPVHGDREA